MSRPNSIAKRDQNDVPVGIGVSSSDGVTPVMLHIDPVTDKLLINVSADSLTLTNSTKDKIDENDIHTKYGISAADGTTILPIRTDSSGKLLVQFTPYVPPVLFTCVLVTPTDGSVVPYGVQLFQATATSPNGIDSVQFKVDGVNKGIPDHTVPYTYSQDWSAYTHGSHHTVYAVALDNLGNILQSNIANITVG